MEKLKELKLNQSKFSENVKKLESWIKNAEEKLKIYEEMSGPKPITFYQSRLKELQIFTEEREKGQNIFNETSDTGEAMYPKINPDIREKIRTEIKNLRSKLDNITDRASTLNKKVESDMMHRSSFEDKYSQVNI